MLCAARVRYGPMGFLDKGPPRTCKHRAKPDSKFCGLHRKTGDRPEVTSTDGGWCIWCAEPGRSFSCSRDPKVTFVLCNACMRAMARELLSAITK